MEEARARSGPKSGGSSTVDVEPWREVRASAVTLRHFHPALATCLFTDAPVRLVEEAMVELGKRFRRSESRVPYPGPRGLFDRVVPQRGLGVLAASAAFGRIAARNATLQGVAGPRSRSAWTKIRSRLMRVYNIKMAPFAVTLFVDDDTVFCPTASSLGPALAALGAGRPDVRFVPQAVAKGKIDDAREEASRLAATAACAAKLGDYLACWDGGGAFRAAAAAGDSAPSPSTAICPSLASETSSRKQRLQGGAVLARRGGRLDDFIDAWIAEYLATYARDLDAEAADAIEGLGSDQPPLREVVAERCLRGSTDRGDWVVGALPANYNARFVSLPSKGFVSTKVVGPNAAFSTKTIWAGAVQGDVAVLHSHVYHHWQDLPEGIISQTQALCGALNRERGIRTYRDSAVGGRHVAQVNATPPLR